MLLQVVSCLLLACNGPFAWGAPSAGPPNTVRSQTCKCTDVCPQLPQNCARGTYKDSCGCCEVCYKDIGEKCGGPADMYGSCGPMLFCKTDSQDLQSAENLRNSASGQLPVGTCWDPRTPASLYTFQTNLRRFFQNLTRNAAQGVNNMWSSISGTK